MSDQPEALRLAEELGVSFQHDFHVVCEEAAAELRRLYKEIAALREERRRDMAEIYSLREAEESLREENERLRDELRQSSIDHTRAEIERLREALEIIAGYRPCIDSLMGNQDIAIAALRDETAVWAARHDPRE